ncbi:PGRS repeat-containing protein, partial [Mycobacterium marinum]
GAGGAGGAGFIGGDGGNGGNGVWIGNGGNAGVGGGAVIGTPGGIGAGGGSGLLLGLDGFNAPPGTSPLHILQQDALNAINAPVQAATERPLIGNGTPGAAFSGADGTPGGWLLGDGGAGGSGAYNGMAGGDGGAAGLVGAGGTGGAGGGYIVLSPELGA